MAFAVSAGSADAVETFQFMKDVIKYIIDKYGTNRIHYALIIYGDERSVKISFRDRITDPEQLKRRLQLLPRYASGSDIEKAIKGMKTLFEGDGVRPDARKVAVIMTDVATTGDKDGAILAAGDLQKNDIEVWVIC